MKRIDTKTLKSWLDAGEKMQLIDVREPNEYKICRLPSSELIPMQNIPQEIARIHRQMPVVVYCHHGIRSAHTILYLEETHRYDNLYNLDGGIDAWAREIDQEMPVY